MKHKIFIYIGLALTAQLGFAAGLTRPVIELEDDSAFDRLKAQDLDPANLYYNQRILTFSEWGKQFPEEQENLSLYRGYVEPTVTVVKDGQKTRAVETLMIFETRSKLILNKPAAEIHPESLIQLATIQAINADFTHRPITAPQFMGNLAGHGPIHAFEWCNPKDDTLFSRSAREKDLKYTNPPDHSWCADSRSICVESCYIYGLLIKTSVNALNGFIADEDSHKDLGEAIQSEIRYFSNENELGFPVQKLTHLETTVRGGLVQSMFYFNQIMEFGKVLGVIQDHPTDPSKAVLTTYFVIGVKQRTWDQKFVPKGLDKLFPSMKEALLGQSLLLQQRGTFSNPADCGITAGLPKFAKCTVSQIGDFLAK